MNAFLSYFTRSIPLRKELFEGIAVLDLGQVADHEGAEPDQEPGEENGHQPEQEREPAFREATTGCHFGDLVRQ